jgi:cytochrome P450
MRDSISEDIPAAGPISFDAELSAWVVTRYDDVLAGLRDERLSAVSAGDDAEPQIFDPAGHAQMRKTAFELFGPARIESWRERIEPLARDMLALLGAGERVDLVRKFAEPWAARVAAIVTGAEENDAARLAHFAQDVFSAAAEPRDSALAANARHATTELARSLRNALGVQAFVALSQTLPCFLASAWLAVLEHPDQAALLRDDRNLMPSAIEELLRFAGPSRAQFRRAVASTALGSVRIAKGDANRDPAHFSDPHELDLLRTPRGHLAFGSGGHACVGSPLIRMAAAVATRALFTRFARMRLSPPVQWRGGFAIRGPASLCVSC